MGEWRCPRPRTRPPHGERERDFTNQNNTFGAEQKVVATRVRYIVACVIHVRQIRRVKRGERLLEGSRKDAVDEDPGRNMRGRRGHGPPLTERRQAALAEEQVAFHQRQEDPLLGLFDALAATNLDVDATLHPDVPVAERQQLRNCALEGVRIPPC